MLGRNLGLRISLAWLNVRDRERGAGSFDFEHDLCRLNVSGACLSLALNLSTSALDWRSSSDISSISDDVAESYRDSSYSSYTIDTSRLAIFSVAGNSFLFLHLFFLLFFFFFFFTSSLVFDSSLDELVYSLSYVSKV